MKIEIVNQEPILVSPDEATKVMQSLVSGADFVVIRGEYVKASVITGIRKNTGDIVTKSMWGVLPAGKMKHFFDDNREPAGDGYKKYKEMKAKLLGGKL